MVDSSGIPIGIVFAFGFFVLMASIAAVNIRLAAQRRRAKEQDETQSQRAESDARKRQNAIREAISRDPSLADSDDPETLARLNQAAESVMQEWRVQKDLAAVKERERQEEQAQAARRRQEEGEHRKREEAEREKERIAALPPVRRWLATYKYLVVAAVAVVVIGVAAGVAGLWQEIERNRVAAQLEQNRLDRIERREQEEAERLAAIEAEKEACSPSTAETTSDSSILRAYTECASPEVRQLVAENPAVSQLALEALVNDDAEPVRYAAVEALRNRVSDSPGNSALEALAGLSSDEDSSIRALIAGGIKIPDAVLREFADDESPVVREALARNPNTSRQTLDQIPWEDATIVADRLAGRPEASPKLLLALAQHPDPEVRREVARNDGATRRVLQTLVPDPSLEVLAAVSFAGLNPTIKTQDAERLREQACAAFEAQGGDNSIYNRC